MTVVMKLSESVPHGPPSISDGPSSTYKAYTGDNHWLSDMQEFFDKIFAGTMLGLMPQVNHRKTTTDEKRTTPSIHGRQRTHVMTNRKLTCKNSSTKSSQGPQQNLRRRHMRCGTTRRPTRPIHKTWLSWFRRGQQDTAITHGLQHPGTRRGLKGPRRLISANKHQNGTRYARMAQ